MFVSFFESFKYTGHLWPVALLRIYAGFTFFNASISKIEQHYLSTPALPTVLQQWLQAGPHNEAYVHFLQTYVLTHWQLFSYLVVTGEFAVGLCYLVGFMVRPAAVVAIFLNYNFLLAGSPPTVIINKLFIAISLCLFFSAAGRCFGFDYYFYKKIRGFWW